ncbi:hypothetical protein D9M69_642940 [compost metagenome]
MRRALIASLCKLPAELTQLLDKGSSCEVGIVTVFEDYLAMEAPARPAVFIGEKTVD